MKKGKGSYFKSLRFRIFVILACVGIFPGISALRIVTSSFEARTITARTRHIRKECENFADLLAKKEYTEDPDDREVNARLELLADVYQGRILVVDRDFRIVRDTYGAEEGQILLSALAIRCSRGEDASEYDKDTHSLKLAVPIEGPNEEGVQGVLLAMIRVEDAARTVQDIRQGEMLLSLTLAAVIVLLAWVASTILVRPFARVTKSIEDLTDGYQDGDISVPDYTETALITDAFNKLLARMKVLDESRSEFVSNVSHELKTPMTSMKVLADSLVGQTGVPEELYQEFLSDITKEVDRENRIISDLLSLVRLDKKTADMAVTHCHVNALVETILKRLRPIADKRNISLILDSYRETYADLDETKFYSAIMNLVDNAVKYNVDDGWVRVSVDADHQYAYVTVADSGMGIPSESLSRIFERFYRVDRSHSREIGGTGLGLAISRSAIMAHRGTLTVESEEGVGTTFRVKVPLSYIP